MENAKTWHDGFAVGYNFDTYPYAGVYWLRRKVIRIVV
jgi:hypothetical protein